MSVSPSILPDEVLQGRAGILCNYRHGLSLHYIETQRWGRLWRKTWWEGQLSLYFPLMWQSTATGRIYMPDRHEQRTDLGSIPPPLQSLFPHTEAPYAYYCHDSAYRHGGLWTADTLDGPWTFATMDRAAVDKLCLLDMMEAGGIGWCRRHIIYRHVRMYGMFAWAPVPPGKD